MRVKIVEFVGKGDLGLASGQKPDGTYERVWYGELIAPDEVAFEAGVFLLTKAKAQALKTGVKAEPWPVPPPEPDIKPKIEPEPQPEPGPEEKTRTFHIVGTVPPEVWNRLGTRILPKLRAGKNLVAGIEFSITVESDLAKTFESDVRQILDDLGLSGQVRVE